MPRSFDGRKWLCRVLAGGLERMGTSKVRPDSPSDAEALAQAKRRCCNHPNVAHRVGEARCQPAHGAFDIGALHALPKGSHQHPVPRMM